MAVLLWLLILSAFHAIALAQRRNFNITLGSSLTPTTNSSWFSPTRRFSFGFYEQTDGYAVRISIIGISKKTAVWTANRNSPVVRSSIVLRLTRDGRLIVQVVGGQEITVVDLSDQAIASASMLDTGNFVLYNYDLNIIWQSFDNPTNTLLPDQHLSPGKELYSSASETDDSLGIFRLKMQNDGYLVQYPVNTPDIDPYAYYLQFGGDRSNVALNFDADGLLYLHNSTMNLLNVTKGGYPSERTIINMMKIDADGILRIYSHSLNQQNSSKIWSSTDDRILWIPHSQKTCLDLQEIQENRNVQLCEDVAPRAFSYAELEKATNGFKEGLGRGAVGTVFKALLVEDQKVIVVKRLDKELVAGETEFQTEIKIIGRTHHRNLVRLLGYCLDGSRMLLVYEYMSYGSLTDVHLIQKSSQHGREALKERPNKNLHRNKRDQGYVAPEWRKCVDWSLDENESILEYSVCDCFDAGELDKLVGDEEVDIRQFKRMVKISIWFIQEPSLRPSMKKVLIMLERTVEIPIPPSPTTF
ncbi:hypothetical protein T459_29922 [Capsicum annuum]|uniref:non-specific serine/threonine protein kinase n=1 Tax=Capsicum annuum TaxID=4072 RepID=A0A2G2Y6V7_CAPAN|nr:hypothetical protein T459_29922 [Capsicum annuum]